MDKQTLSNYGWIVICTLVLVVMIALSGPFGTFVSEAVQSTTQGLFDVNQNALDAAGIEMQEQKFDTMLNGGNAGQAPVVTVAATFADGTTMTWEELKTQYGVTDTEIPANAFTDADITSIVIPASVTAIGSNAFDGCSNLTTIEYLGTTAIVGSLPRGVNPTIYVPADYQGDHFCGLAITKR